MTSFEYIESQIAMCERSSFPVGQICYVRGLIDMAERTQSITPAESTRLHAAIHQQDKAYTDKVLGRTA